MRDDISRLTINNLSTIRHSPMTITTIPQETSVNRLRTAFTNIIAVEAKQIPRSLTR
jgi:hypothetical protein